MDKLETEKVIENRLAAVRAELDKTDIEMLIVTKEENKYYLSMFSSTSYELIVGRNESWLLTDFRYAEAASKLSSVYNIIITKPDYSIREFLKEKGVKKVGLEFKNASVDYFIQLENALPDDAEILSFDGMIEKIRSVKDMMELAYITKAEKIGDQAFSYILGEIKPGVTEKEIAFKLEMKMRELGAEKLSFDTIVVSGKRTSMPHGHPSDNKIEKGDFVTMDFGCVFNGYCSDMTRTVAVGSVSSEQRKIYDIVLKAQTAVCDTIKAGMKASDADAVARDIITAEGYGECFGHGLGHGVGLEIHEAPTANPRSKEILEPGMLVTIEPGIYIPEKFGVRIEDLSFVTENGIINLTGSEKGLIVL
jgi:Xaa-Pro aminopeptidase